MTVHSNLKSYLELSHKPLKKLNPELRSWSKKYSGDSVKIALKPIITGGDTLLDRLSKLLFLTYGITNLHIASRAKLDFIRQNKRPLPSGGALYPNEIYVYINIDNQELRRGIYHYNPFSHNLTLVRYGDHNTYIINSICHLDNISKNDILLFTTCLLDKNSYRYYDWSYRIQNIDTGLLIQRISQVSNYMQNSTIPYFNFNDNNIAKLLKIEEDEGILSICKICGENNNEEIILEPINTEYSLENNIPEKHSDYYKGIIEFHNSTKVSCEVDFPESNNQNSDFKTISHFKLPQPQKIEQMEMSEYLYSRYTTFHFFEKKALELQCLTNVLYNSFTYIHESIGISNIIELFIIVNNVEGLEPGLYSYNYENNILKQYNKKNISSELRSYIIHPTLDINNVSAVFIMVGNYNSINFNNRIFRTVNLNAGFYLGSLINYSINAGIGRYPLLSYDVEGLRKYLRLKDNSFPLTMFLTGIQRKNLMKLKYPMYL